MNVFRLLGDLSHLGAIIILLLKIWKTRSCAGISGKTQAMFALVFITRYLDLFVHFVSLYNTGTDQICFLRLFTIVSIQRKLFATNKNISRRLKLAQICLPPTIEDIWARFRSITWGGRRQIFAHLKSTLKVSAIQFTTCRLFDERDLGELFYRSWHSFHFECLLISTKVMKVIYIALSIGTCYLIFFKFKATYDGNHDSMRAEFLVVPAAGLACLINNDFSVLEILWTFSIYLEAVAILPQLFMISKVRW